MLEFDGFAWGRDLLLMQLYPHAFELTFTGKGFERVTLLVRLAGSVLTPKDQIRFRMASSYSFGRMKSPEDSVVGQTGASSNDQHKNSLRSFLVRNLSKQRGSV